MERNISVSAKVKTVTLRSWTPQESWSSKQLEQIEAQLAKNGYQCEVTPSKVIIKCATENELFDAYDLAHTMNI